MIQRFCQVCGKTFSVYPSGLRGNHKSIFCSRECRAKGRIGTHQSPAASLLKSKALSKGVKRICHQCGKDFIVRPSIIKDGGGKFCSKDCYAKSKKGKRILCVKYPLSDETKRKIGLKSKERGAILNALKTICQKPNKQESYLNEILDAAFPSQWEYVGDGKLVINGLVPDFANVNGKKAVIEVFGDYWHGVEKTKSDWRRTELGRIMVFNAMGYRCLIIWQHELKELTQEEIVNKVKSFAEAQ